MDIERTNPQPCQCRTVTGNARKKTGTRTQRKLKVQKLECLAFEQIPNQAVRSWFILSPSDHGSFSALPSPLGQP
jgi:hypothetical protein